MYRQHNTIGETSPRCSAAVYPCRTCVDDMRSGHRSRRARSLALRPVQPQLGSSKDKTSDSSCSSGNGNGSTGSFCGIAPIPVV